MLGRFGDQGSQKADSPANTIYSLQVGLGTRSALYPHSPRLYTATVSACSASVGQGIGKGIPSVLGRSSCERRRVIPRAALLFVMAEGLTSPARSNGKLLSEFACLYVLCRTQQMSLDHAAHTCIQHSSTSCQSKLPNSACWQHLFVCRASLARMLTTPPCTGSSKNST